MNTNIHTRFKIGDVVCLNTNKREHYTLRNPYSKSISVDDIIKTIWEVEDAVGLKWYFHEYDLELVSNGVVAGIRTGIL